MPTPAVSAERERPATPAGVKSPTGVKAVESRTAVGKTLETRHPAAAKAVEGRSLAARETGRR
jgi:hypothetical protein